MQRKSYTGSKEKLRKKIALKKKMINQPIFIRDILLYSDKTEECPLIILDTMPEKIPVGSYLLIKDDEGWKLFYSQLSHQGEYALRPIFLRSMARLEKKLLHFSYDFKVEDLSTTDKISIKNIIASYHRDMHSLQDYSYGEASGSFTMSGQPHIHSSPYQEIETTERLIDQIRMIASIANGVHEQFNCDTVQGQCVAIEGKTNHITRIATSEFYFYTLQPLEMAQYEFVFGEIEKIAAQYHTNVHLILSSIAVRVVSDETDKILNLTLHVQCGRHPIIHPVCKTTPSKNDVAYHQCENFSYSENVNSFSCFISSEKSRAINLFSRNFFTIETEGGAKYTQAIDICLENSFEKAKHLIKWSITHNSDSDTDIIPRQANHVLTSNATDEKRSARITDSFTHVDPVHPRNRPLHLLAHTINDRSIIKIEDLERKYPSMSISISKGVINIINPPFGADISLLIFPEKPIHNLSDELNHDVKSHNKLVKKSLLRRRLLDSHYDVDAFEATLTRDRLAIKKNLGVFDRLISSLILKYTPHGFYAPFLNHEAHKKIVVAILAVTKDKTQKELKNSHKIEDLNSAMQILSELTLELIENLNFNLGKNATLDALIEKTIRLVEIGTNELITEMITEQKKLASSNYHHS